ncbi:MAG TPA: carboxypeptidase regulatory-like domain-containing protein [Longimicrobium sp.]|nr:carboxypeptidase regulatory-like domain-containing protein [Longimicrobium sp.]
MQFPILLVVVLGLCAADRAEAQPARVERRGAAEVAGTPGEPLTLPFRVTNLSGAPAALAGEASVPGGWRIAGGGVPGTLAAGQSELRLVGVGVPAGAAAGRHVVRYRAGGAADSAVVVVAERRAVVAEPVDGEGMAVAGTAYAVRFRVANRGNVAERLAIRAEGDQGIRPAADSSALLLPPGAEATVTVRGQTDARTSASLRHQVTLHAAGADPAASASAVARTMVRVVPRGGGRVQRPRLPAEVRVRAADSLSAASVSFSAHGPLDAAGRVRLDVEARTADPAGTPFARHDEYRLRLDGPGFGLQLGDGVYALSRLTEPGRYGFGAGGSVSRGLVHAGGMVARDRRGEGRGGVAGGFARLGTERMRVGLAYARPDSAPARWTVGGVAEPHRLLRVEAEAAPASGDSVLPRSLHLRGSSRILSYDVLHLRGGPAYHGLGTTDQDFASATLRPFGALSLSASARRGGDVVLAADSVIFLRAFRRAGLSWGSWLLVEAREAAGDSASRGDFRSVYGRIGVPLWRNGWIYPGVEAGTVVAAPGAAPEPYRVYSLQSTFSGRGASLWASVQLRDGASAYQAGNRELSGAFSAHVPVLPRTLLRVAGQGRRIGDRVLEGSLDVTLERRLPADHRVAIRGLAVAQPLGGWRPRMYVEYGVPLGIPLPARGQERVVVRVVDAGTGRPMAGLLVRAGDRMAVTDRRGVAVFANLGPGTHPLRVEASAGPELVADRPLPAPMAGGGTARVQLGMQAAARLQGTVRRVAADSAAAPMAGVTVRITGPGGAHRAVTDAEGRFRVAGMRPGWWRVRVDAASLPRHHAPRADQHVLLQPGGSGEALVEVVERERAIQMIQGAELTLQ